MKELHVMAGTGIGEACVRLCDYAKTDGPAFMRFNDIRIEATAESNPGRLGDGMAAHLE